MLTDAHLVCVLMSVRQVCLCTLTYALTVELCPGFHVHVHMESRCGHLFIQTSNKTRKRSGPEVIKQLLSMLNTTEHEIYSAHNSLQTFLDISSLPG